MDEIMDTKVVQMKFDNSQFRAGVQDTIKQLTALDESLRLQGASDGLDQVVKASKKTTESMDDMSRAVDEVQKHFSMLEVVGITVMMRLTNAVIDYSKKTVNRLWSSTIGQVISGGKIRSQNIENAKFQLEGLGVAWKDISEDINYGVKDTAYGLDEAARVASQLVASQVELGDEMKASLRAISGVAAMTNSQYGEIGHIFTTVASNGKLMTMQLRELSNRGLNASAQIARYFREVRGETEATEESINNMVSRGLIDFQTFASAMDWAFGEHAKEANKTFQGAMSNVRSALSRIGAKFADPVYDNLRKVFNGLIPVIDNINKAMDPVVQMFTMMINAVGDLATGYLQIDDMSRGFMTIVIDTYSYLKPILEAFMDIFGKYIPLIDTGARSFSDFVKQFALVGEKAEKARDVFKSLFSVVDLFIKVGVSGFKILKTIVKGLLGVFQALTGSMEPPLDILYRINVVLEKLLDVAVNFVQARLEKTFEQLAAALKLVNWEKVLKWITNITVVLVVAWELLVKLVNLAIVGFNKLLPALSTAGVILAGIVSSAIYGISVIGSLISSIFGRGRNLVSNIIVRAQGLDQISGIQNAGEAIASTSDDTSEFNDELAQTADAIDEVNDRLEATDKNVGRLNKDIPELTKGLGNFNRERREQQEGDKDNSSSYLSRHFNEEMDEVNKMLEKGKGSPHFNKSVGFFETLASYFVDDKYTAVFTVARAVDDFLNQVYAYVRDNFAPFKDKITEIFNAIFDPIKENPLNAIPLASAVTTIAMVVLVGKLLHAIFGILDFIPQLGRAIGRASMSLVLAQVSSILHSLALTFIGLSVFVATIAVVASVTDIDEVTRLFRRLRRGIVEIAEEIFWLVLAWQGLMAMASLFQFLSDFVRLRRGLELRTSGLKKITDLMKAFSLTLISVVASIAVMAYLYDTYGEAKVTEAFSAVLFTVTMMLGFVYVLKKSEYALAQGTYTLTISRKGISKSAPVFRNSLMGIMVGFSLMLAAAIGAMAFFMHYYDESDKLDFAGKALAQLMVAIVGFLGLLTWYAKVLEPKVGFNDIKNNSMMYMAQSVANIAKVIRALGLSLIMVAAALWIVSQVEIPDDDRAFKAFFIIAGVIGFLSSILPLIISKIGVYSGKDLIAVGGAMAVFAVALGLMLLAMGGMFKIMENVDASAMPLKTIIAIVSILSALIAILAIFGKASAGTLVAAASVFGFVSLMFAAIGGMFYAIGQSGISVSMLKAILPLFYYLITWLGVLSTVIAILGALPGVNVAVMATLAALAAVFGAMGWLFWAVGWAATSIGDSIKKIIEAIDDFTRIDWGLAKRSARDFGIFINRLRASIKIMTPSAMLGFYSLSFICKEIAKAIKNLSGVDPESATLAAEALGGFISTIVDYKRDISKFVEVMESINAIIWLAVAASIGLALAAAFLTAAVLLLTIPAAIMVVAGDGFEMGLVRLVDALVGFGEAFEENGQLLKKFVFDLFNISLVLLISSAMLDIGIGLLWYGALLMEKTANLMDKNFPIFIDAITNAGEVLAKNDSALKAARKAFIDFGIAAIISGGMLAIAAVVFGIAAAIICLVALTVAYTVKLSMEWLADASDSLEDIGENIDDFMKEIESAADRLFNIADSVNEASKLWSEGVNRFLHPIRNAETSDEIDVEEEMDSAASDAVAGFATSVDVYMRTYCPGYTFAQAFIDQVRGPQGLNEHSPSRVTYEIGKFAVEGFANGLADNIGLVQTPLAELIDQVTNGLNAITSRASEAGKKAVENYSKGMTSGRMTVGTKGFDLPGHDDPRENEQEQRERGYNEGAAYNEGQAQAQQEGIQQATTFQSYLGRIFNTDRIAEGRNTIGTFISGLFNNMGIDLNNIKGNVKSLWETVAQWIGNALEHGIASSIDQILRYIAKVRAMNQDNWTETQRQAQAAASGNTAAYIATTSGIQHANEYDIYRELKNSIHLPSADELLGSIDDLLYNLPSGSIGTDGGGDTSSDLAAAIAGSSGAGSGINDQSKAASIGGGIGNTITNSNNTYNFYQNNYSPEPLNRSAIYQQTRQQLNGFYTYAKEKGLSY